MSSYHHKLLQTGHVYMQHFFSFIFLLAPWCQRTCNIVNEALLEIIYDDGSKKKKKEKKITISVKCPV